MARTITQGFEQLRQNLEITGLQAETVSTRQQNVRAALDDGLTVLETFLTGSYRRNTMVAPLKEADVDIVAVMDSSYFEQWNGQASLLDKVRRVLLKRYPTTPKISRDGQAVTIEFTDFCVDVVPAFNRPSFIRCGTRPRSARSRWRSPTGCSGSRTSQSPHSGFASGVTRT